MSDSRLITFSAPQSLFHVVVTDSEMSLLKLKEIVQQRLSTTEFTLYYATKDEPRLAILDTEDDFEALSILTREYSRIHVSVVTQLSVGTGSHRRPFSLGNYLLRPSLIAYLYGIAQEHHFFVVKGTPGSGKTTTCIQLFNHILHNAPNDRVSHIEWWSQAGHNEDSLIKSCHRGDLEDPKCLLDHETPHWVLVDEAQKTYRDMQFWNFIKNLPAHFRVVLFTSYGSPRSALTADVIGNPNAILPHLVMGLRPSSNGLLHRPQIPGLYFQRFEYDELLATRIDFPEMEPELADWVFQSSSGHIGAIDSLLLCIKSVAKIKHAQSLTFADFLSYFTNADHALMECSRGLAFDRGVPNAEALKLPSNISAVKFLRRLSIAGGVMAFAPSEFGDEADGVWFAHQRGWVTLDDRKTYILVELPSPLHRARLSYHLQSTSVSPHFDAMTLREFIIEVVRNFSSDAVALAHRLTSGPLGTQSIPEAQWQNEVYRCAHKVTGGSGLWFSPEFGTPKTAINGRIDFYVGTKKWGIEILREGDRMDEHVGRFVPGGAYHKWITTGAITEYVILDFRTHSTPRQKIPRHPIFHIRFNDNFTTFTILDSELKTITTGSLLSK